jgi:hypothetical protein
MKRHEEWVVLPKDSKLYVDALNFSREFGFTTKLWNIEHAVKCITKFVTATRQGMVEVTVFIDAGIGTEEGSGKWRSRREVDVQTERRGVPQGTNVLVGDIFRSLGVPVFYSGPGQDLDDCLACYATVDGAAILSNDGDYFRYIGRTYVQYGKFKFDANGDLLLNRRSQNKYKEAPQPRRLFKSKPEMLSADPSLVSLKSNKLYLRGAPSPLVKLCGNPHRKATLLRCALYARLGVTEKVREEWPEWDESKKAVIWYNKEVEPNDSELALFDQTPGELFARFFGSEERPKVADLEDWEWENHLFACKAVVYELWLLGQQDRGGKTLLSLLTSSDDSVNSLTGKLKSLSVSNPELAPEMCDTFHETGYCKFCDKCFRALGHKKCSYFKKGACRRGNHCLFFHGK